MLKAWGAKTVKTKSLQEVNTIEGEFGNRWGVGRALELNQVWNFPDDLTEEDKGKGIKFVSL